MVKTTRGHTAINNRGSAPKKIPPSLAPTGKPPGPQRVIRPSKDKD